MDQFWNGGTDTSSKTGFREKLLGIYYYNKSKYDEMVRTKMRTGGWFKKDIQEVQSALELSPNSGTTTAI